jgi:hypothetical protein
LVMKPNGGSRRASIHCLSRSSCGGNRTGEINQSRIASRRQNASSLGLRTRPTRGFLGRGPLETFEGLQRKLNDKLSAIPSAAMFDAAPRRAGQSIPALRLDPYATSSLLQKAIRRGEKDLAERAAMRLYRLRGKGVWRRFIVIAFEDVGIGSVESLVTTTTIALDALNGTLRFDAELAIAFIARLLADAPKDRSSDHLVGAAFSHPIFEDARRIIAASSPAEQLDLIAEEEAALPVRAIAVWRSSGMKWGATPGGQSRLPDLMAAFR